MREELQGPGLLCPAAALSAAMLLSACNGSGDPPTAPDAAIAASTDPCVRTASLATGPADGPLYRTLAPFEHHDIDRTQTFAQACTLAELGGGTSPVIKLRTAPDDYLMPYIVQTRDRDQLFLYGYGADARHDGAYVAAIDADTLQQRWRTNFSLEPAGSGQQPWSWPGVVTIHGNGKLYAVYGNQFYKLDPDSGAILAQRALPQGDYGAVYNGMDVLPDGRLVAKNMEAGPCPPLDIEALLPAALKPLASSNVFAESFGGLACYLLFNHAASTLVVIDPDTLDIVDQLTLPEPVTGRVTTARDGDHAEIYVAGAKSLYRYRYDDGHLSFDAGWGPVEYAEPGQGPAAGAVMLGDFVVIQNTGYLRPGSLVAVDVHDAHHVFRTEPFALVPGQPLEPSFVLSKPAADPDNQLVVAIDVLSLQMGAFHFDPEHGFTRLWRRPVFSLAFPALVGPPDSRQIVVPDALKLSGRGQRSAVLFDRVRWFDEASGELLASSPVLSTLPAPGNIVTPGFNGRFYYPGADGKLRELSVAASQPAEDSP